MDTNLKTSKKVRAFIYRLFAFGAFFSMLAITILGREAFINYHNEGKGTLTGNIYYLTEFREYISELYMQAMLGYAGIGDDNGYPLTDANANLATLKARTSFSELAAKGSPDLTYYIGFDKYSRISENVTFPLFSEYDDHLLLSEDVTLCCYWNGKDDTGSALHFFTKVSEDMTTLTKPYYTVQYSPNAKAATDVRVLIAITNNDYQSSYLQELAETAMGYAKILWMFISSCILFVIFGVLSLLTLKAGKHAQNSYVQIASMLWFEIKLTVIIAVISICFNLHLWHFDGVLFRRIFASNYVYLYIPAGILLYLFLTDLFTNRGITLKNSLIYKLLQYIGEFVTGLVWKRKAMLLQLCTLLASLLMILVGAILVWADAAHILYSSRWILRYCRAFGIALLLLGILLFVVSLLIKKFIKDTASLTEKLSHVQTGQESEPLTLSKHSLLKEAADQLNSVEHGIEAAVDEANRSNKMRVELITNVSHDLKTPLTSIINYADLLCEENLPGPADEYATALRSKAYRLKDMVQDVFEISKATSGNLPVEMVQLDLVKLIRQTLADMDERIQDSTLTFKLNIADEPLMIEADGEKLYRVFQNLFVNALQYSLENSRVHIFVSREETNAHATIKNISRQEINFDTTEIVERFVRADASRTTEGSGLGLSIAQSFTEACGGTFQIETDADMFTAHVRFPLLPNE